MAAKDEVRRSKLEDNNLLSPPPPPPAITNSIHGSQLLKKGFRPRVESSSKLWKNPAWICPLRYGVGGVGILGMMIGRAVEW